jgi:hypothetical protein
MSSRNLNGHPTAPPATCSDLPTTSRTSDQPVGTPRLPCHWVVDSSDQVLVLVRRSARSVVPLAQLGRLPLLRYAHAVRRIKGLAFGHHRPRQMQQLARGGAAGDLHRLASRA